MSSLPRYVATMFACGISPKVFFSLSAHQANEPENWNEMLAAINKEGAEGVEQALKRHFLGIALFDIRTPMVENRYNTRVPTTTAINLLYRSTGYGTDLQTHNIETALKITCSRQSIDPSSLTTDMNAVPKPAVWTSHAKAHPPVVADGHHRIGLLRDKVVEPLEKDLDIVRKHIGEAEKGNYSGALEKLCKKKKEVENRIKRDCLWLAKLYDKGP